MALLQIVLILLLDLVIVFAAVTSVAWIIAKVSLMQLLVADAAGTQHLAFCCRHMRYSCWCVCLLCCSLPLNILWTMEDFQ